MSDDAEKRARELLDRIYDHLGGPGGASSDESIRVIAADLRASRAAGRREGIEAAADEADKWESAAAAARAIRALLPSGGEHG